MTVKNILSTSLGALLIASSCLAGGTSAQADVKFAFIPDNDTYTLGQEETYKLSHASKIVVKKSADNKVSYYGLLASAQPDYINSTLLASNVNEVKQNIKTSGDKLESGKTTVIDNTVFDYAASDNYKEFDFSQSNSLPSVKLKATVENSASDLADLSEDELKDLNIDAVVLNKGEYVQNDFVLQVTPTLADSKNLGLKYSSTGEITSGGKIALNQSGLPKDATSHTLVAQKGSKLDDRFSFQLNGNEFITTLNTPKDVDNPDAALNAPKAPNAALNAPDAPKAPNAALNAPDAPKAPDAALNAPDAPKAPDAALNAPDAPKAPDAALNAPDAPKAPAPKDFDNSFASKADTAKTEQLMLVHTFKVGGDTYTASYSYQIQVETSQPQDTVKEKDLEPAATLTGTDGKITENGFPTTALNQENNQENVNKSKYLPDTGGVHMKIWSTAIFLLTVGLISTYLKKKTKPSIKH